MPWQLQVVGSVRLYDTTNQLEPERKTAAVLTYLALEGPAPRSKLAGLLWPEVEERPARNNLAQTLRRLKKVTEVDLVVGDDTLKLADDLEVDIAHLNVLAFQSNYEELLKITGELLPYDYDDLPGLSDWLTLEREKLLKLRREALTSLIKQNEKVANYEVALSYAQQLLHLDTIDEEAYRLLMRLHYLSGNRAEAMKVFERCKSVLQKELEVEPSLETHKLAADIGFGTLELFPAKPKETTLPLSVLRPPVLVGREKEWEQLEAAWEAGLNIFIHGEPGVGKTRLMLDFVASKGTFFLFDARPGDTSVLYGTNARVISRYLEEHPNLELEPWVRLELSRINPRLAIEAPPPMQGEADKLRFLEALAWTLKTAYQMGHVAMVMDDLQFIDPGSFEAGSYLVGQFESLRPRFLLVSIYRTNELSPEVQNGIDALLQAGLAINIELEPLRQEDVSSLLAELDLPKLGQEAETLTRYTGGNPMFLLETVRSLLESGKQTFEKPLPLSGKVKAVIQKRLEMLSSSALKLARVASVANTDFSPQLAEHVLNQDAFDLAESFAELERLHVLQGAAFAHDLIYEATLAGIPVPIKTLLHGRVAAWLEGTKANPARIAQHYLDAGEEAKATAFLFEAAKKARETFLYADALKLFNQTVLLADCHGFQELAFEGSVNITEILAWIDQGKRYAEAAQALMARARTSAQKVDAYKAHANVLVQQGKAAEAEEAARQGISYADEVGNLASKASLMSNLGMTLFMQERFADAVEVYKAAIELRQQIGDDSVLGDTLDKIAQSLLYLERPREAIEYSQRALEVFKQQNRQEAIPLALGELSRSQRSLGMVRAGVETLLESLAIHDSLPGNEAQKGFDLMSLSVYHGELCDFRQALECLEKAETLWNKLESNYGVHVHRHLAPTLTVLGAYEQAESRLERFLGGVTMLKQFRGMGLLYLARLRHLQHLPSQEILNEAKELLESSGRPLLLGSWNLQQAVLLTPRKALPLVEQTLESARKYELYGLVIAAETRLAQVHFQLKREAQAKEHSSEAIQLLETYDPVDFYRGEVLFTHYQNLKANKDKSANGWLEQTLNWLLDIANNKVPPEYRESFLTDNPVNKAILAEAKKVGLEPSKELS